MAHYTMLNHLSSAEQSQFTELQGKLAQLTITEAEQQLLNGLVRKAQKTAADRSAAIDAIRKSLSEGSISITDVFSVEDIQRAAAILSAPQKGPRKQRVVSEKASKPAKAAKAAGADVVLVQVKLDKSAGAPSRYKKGQKLGKFVSNNFKRLDADGQLIENLLKYATPLGKTYFATDEGRAELQAFAKFVHETPVAA